MTQTISAPVSSAMIRQLRPRQWIKNALVVAPVAAAGEITDADHWLPLLGAFVAMSLAASSTYVVNDLNDLDEDRRHPVKSLRPLASGAITTSTGTALAIGTVATSLGIAALVGWPTLCAVIVYLAITYSYSYLLKHVPVVELVVVAIGFPLRTVVGGLATEIPLTTNFLLVVAFGALFVVAAKRSAELLELGEEAAGHRSALATYSPGYLRLVQSIALSVMLVVYGLWTFGGEVSSSADSIVWFQLSMIPLVVAVLRYAWLVDRGLAGAPEEVFLRDRAMILIAVVWMACYGTGIGLG